MKNIAVFIALAFVVILGACKKDKTTQSGDLQMSAKVNNLPWRSYSASASLDTPPGTNIVVTADSTNSRIKLRISNYHGVGTYSFADSGNTATYYNFRSPPGAQAHEASSGKIEVTYSAQSGNSETTLKGTFSFNSNTFSISEGIFDVKLNLN